MYTYNDFKMQVDSVKRRETKIKVYGTDSDSIDGLVTRIEKSDLTVAEKHELERLIFNRMTSYWGDCLQSSQLNMFFIKKFGMQGFFYADKLADVKTLMKYGVVYSEGIIVKYEEIIPVIEGITSQPISIPREKYRTVIRLTEFGKTRLDYYARQGERIANQRYNQLKQLGLV